MKLPVNRAAVLVLTLASTAPLKTVSAQEQPQAQKTVGANEETSTSMPELADVIPLSAELTVRQAALVSEMEDRLDPSEVEDGYERVQAEVDRLAERFERLRTSEDYKQNEFVELSDALRQERESFEETSQRVREAIRRLADFREDWVAEEKRWNEWRDVLIQEKGLDQLGSTFEKVHATIDDALGLVVPELDSMLRIQEQGGAIDARLKILASELDGLAAEKRLGALVKETSPFFSLGFFSQFTSAELWSAARQGFREASRPWGRFVDDQGWILLLQGLVSLFAIIAIQRNRALVSESKRWRFLAERTFSAGLFLGYLATVLIYESQGTPSLCKRALSIVGAISFARLVGALIEASWKRRFVYGLMTVLAVLTLVEMFDLPLPFLRLFVVGAALTAIPFCWRWAGQSRRQKESTVCSWGLFGACFFFAAVVIAELWGKAQLSSYLLLSAMRSVAAVLLFSLLTYMIHGVLERLFRGSFIKQAASVSSDTDALGRRVGVLVDIGIWGVVLLPGLLVIWGGYDGMEDAIRGLLGLGFDLGSQRVTVGLLIMAAGFFYSAFLLSWILQNLFLEKMLLKRGVQTGVRISIKRLLHYVLICIGFLLAVSSLGLDLTRLTILLSALGVGIGFGLQGIVNNFVSGLVLLFERPVRVGDYIELNGNWCEIGKIGLRATTVQTFDQADVIIPNADLVTNEVTNWTLRNRRARLIVPVGVAYGSDIALVMKTLRACADPNPMLAKDPTPQVLFMRFGESSLDFELRVWVLDVDQRLTVLSDLHQEIDRRFREAEIEIAFPQLDLHFRNAVGSFSLPSPEQDQDLEA